MASDTSSIDNDNVESPPTSSDSSDHLRRPDDQDGIGLSDDATDRSSENNDAESPPTSPASSDGHGRSEATPTHDIADDNSDHEYLGGKGRSMIAQKSHKRQKTVMDSRCYDSDSSELDSTDDDNDSPIPILQASTNCLNNYLLNYVPFRGKVDQPTLC